MGARDKCRQTEGLFGSADDHMRWEVINVVTSIENCSAYSTWPIIVD